MMVVKKTLLTLVLLSGLAAAQYVPPPWWTRISNEDTTGQLRRCFKRTVPPVDGSRCSRNPKLCYFDTQQCAGVGPHPVTKCTCDGNIWNCAPESCPGCTNGNDCQNLEICFAEDDPFCGICFQDPFGNCSADTDCFGTGQVCDDRKQPCQCNPGNTCNSPCTSNADCGTGDTCSLPDGHCGATTCTTDSDCIDHFACTTTCARRTCSSQADCAVDGGFCVKGRCYETLGFCSFPPP